MAVVLRRLYASDISYVHLVLGALIARQRDTIPFPSLSVVATWPIDH